MGKRLRKREHKHCEFSYPSPELVAFVVADVLKRNAKVIDVGCGGGIDAIFMAQCGFRVIGVDISLTALKIAEKRARKAHVEVDWCRRNVLQLPIKDGIVDFVIDRGLFHLVEDGDRPGFASEIFRILKNKGRALIRGSSGESPHDQFNHVIEEAIDRYFVASKFKRGLVLSIPLFSVEGLTDGRIVVLTKTK